MLKGFSTINEHDNTGRVLDKHRTSVSNTGAIMFKWPTIIIGLYNKKAMGLK